MIESAGSLFYKLPLASASGQINKKLALAEYRIKLFLAALAQIKAMPFVKVWIHFVWSTKNREPFLNDEIRQKIFRHIRENAKEKAIHLDFINGYVDHVHCLISLGTDQTIEKIMQLIKGESSFWINKNDLCKSKFGWQDEYFAVSVSESNLENVRKYIAKQEEHHRAKSFDDEFEDFLIRAGFQRFND